MNGLNRSALLIATLLSIVFALPAHAKTLEKKPLPRPKVLRPTTPPPKTLASRKKLREQSESCNSRKAVLDQERQRFDHYNADLNSVNAEIIQLQRRLRELSSRSKHLKSQVSAQKSRVTRIERTYREECRETENCAQYERTAQSLERRERQLGSNLDQASDEIRSTRSDIGRLKRRLTPLQAQYRNRKCDRLVPGKTSQSTIDHCSTLFSEWNRLQSSLNRHNSRLSGLRAEHERIITELTSLDRRAKQINTYISRHCLGSQSTLKVLDVKKRKGLRDRAHNLGRELDRLLDDISKLRKIEITIQAN